MRCPICKKQFDETAAGVRLPFCTDRCKLIDLGRWLDGAYQIPVDDADTAGDVVLDDAVLPPSTQDFDDDSV